MRDIMGLMEEQNQAIYFHATFATRVPAIRENGILNGKRRVWSTPMGVKQGKTGLIYLFGNSTSAVRWAAKMEWEFKKPATILVIANPPGLIVPDDHIQMIVDGFRAFTTDTPVPPECIIDAIPLTLEMKRELSRKRQVSLGYGEVGYA